MTMSVCESFEITIERERYGAASADERAALTVHLKTCERCRIYAETSARAQRALAAAAEIDWAPLEARLRGAGPARLRRTLVLSLIGPVAIALAIWGLGGEAISLIGTVGAIVGSRVVADVARNRRLTRPVERQELFEAHREDLARQIRRLTVLRWVAMTLIVVLLGFAVREPTLRGRVVFVALAVIASGVWAERLLVGLPALRRELELVTQGMR